MSTNGGFLAIPWELLATREPPSPRPFYLLVVPHVTKTYKGGL